MVLLLFPALAMAKKKGFMTPERKKKLRTLLRKKAVEELKKEQERKVELRIKTIAERCGSKADIENLPEEELKKVPEILLSGNLAHSSNLLFC